MLTTKEINNMKQKTCLRCYTHFLEINMEQTRVCLCTFSFERNICSTSLFGGNQVDGLPPAPSESRSGSRSRSRSVSGSGSRSRSRSRSGSRSSRSRSVSGRECELE